MPARNILLLTRLPIASKQRAGHDNRLRARRGATSVLSFLRSSDEVIITPDNEGVFTKGDSTCNRTLHGGVNTAQGT